MAADSAHPENYEDVTELLATSASGSHPENYEDVTELPATSASGSHPENYEDVTIYGLDDADEQELLVAHNECTFIWSNKEGWPVGVIMSYVYRNGKFWLTASGQRARISAVRRDPRVSIVVTSTGSPVAKNKTVTWKGTCIVHDGSAPENAELKAWFYNELSAALNRGDEKRQAYFSKFLDSPRRVILEVDPTQRIGYDGTKMGRATAAWIAGQAAADGGVA